MKIKFIVFSKGLLNTELFQGVPWRQNIIPYKQYCMLIIMLQQNLFTKTFTVVEQVKKNDDLHM